MKHLLLLLALLIALSVLFAQPDEVASDPTGSIRIITRFGGDAYLDGEFYQSLFAQSNLLWNNIPAGEHTVELRNSKGVFNHKLTVKAFQETLLDFDNPPKPNPNSSPTKTVSPKLEPQMNIQPIVSRVSFGTGKLNITSAIAGDVYLGGMLLGSVKAHKLTKFNNLPRGDYSLELFGANMSCRKEISIVHKGVLPVTITELDLMANQHDLIYIPGGTYFRGTQYVNRFDNERPRHKVTLAPLLIGKTEVKQKLWQDVMGTNPSVRTDANQPVTNVSWYEAIEFCNLLSQRDGLNPCYTINQSFPDANNVSDFDSLRFSVSCDWTANGYRLPTEAEWEYAAKSGDSFNTLLYAGSDKIKDVAWYADNSADRVQLCAQKKPNAFGLYDMSGNVFEWCWDYWGAYGKEALDNPTGAKSGAYRIIRGGSWQSDATQCVTTYRGGSAAQEKSKDIGFRIVRSARAYKTDNE